MALTTPGVIKASSDILLELAPEINLIKLFQYDLSNDVADYGAKIRVATLASGGTQEYNATTSNYSNETGSFGEVWVQLTHQPKSTMKITSEEKLELPNDQFWAKAVEAGRNAVSKAISDTIGGLFTTDNCKAGKITMASVTKNALAKLRTQAAGKGRIGDYVLLLDSDYYADAISLFDSNIYGGIDPIQNGYVPRLYGFKAVAMGVSFPEGVKGVLVPATGVCTAVRPVAIPSLNDYPEAGVVTDENGFSLLTMRHTDFSTGSAYVNVTTLVGATLARENETFYIANS